MRHSARIGVAFRFNSVHYGVMKRNMDLIREILLKTEEKAGAPMELKNCSGKEEFLYHVVLLKDAGFVEAIIRPDHKGVPAAALIQRLTWAGCDFLDSTRKDSIWSAVKDKIVSAGSALPLSVITELAKEIA